MKLFHISDSHGFPYMEIPDSADVIVLTGDILPDDWDTLKRNKILGLPMPSLISRKEYQEYWLLNNLQAFVAWTKNKPLMWCSGNHDYFNPCKMLSDAGINVFDTNDRMVNFGGMSWYGFPYVNFIDGNFVYEKSKSQMVIETNNLLKTLSKFEMSSFPDIFLAHAPLAGIYDRDKNGNSYGNSVLLNCMLYSDKKLPNLYLCGHVHAPDGGYELNGMRIFNSATSSHLIEI